MTPFQIISILLALTALFAYANWRWVGLPTTIGVMAGALLFSFAFVLLGKWGAPAYRENIAAWLGSIDFNAVLLHGMLAFLLFAGALHVDIGFLRRETPAVIALATLGVFVSTFIVGSLSWLALKAVGLPTSFLMCLTFGALISPTDPIAVMGVMKIVKAPKSLETQLVGESLFNDGIGVVIFLVLLQTAQSHGSGGAMALMGLRLFGQQAVGGAVVGLLCGLAVHRLMRKVQHLQVELLMTLALASAGYALADAVHVSAPIAVVVAGLLIGNQGRSAAMSDESRVNLDMFWELVDEILNAILFLLIGLEVLAMPMRRAYLAAAALIIPVVLLARWLSVSGIIVPLRRWTEVRPGAIRLLTWGGLRGGLSVAMALSLPTSDRKDAILAITYAVVIFSIMIQGLTIRKMAVRLFDQQQLAADPSVKTPS